ncbi:MAG: hypothetical protein AAGF12_28100 [Myxococcota bacterium]
MTRPTPRFAVVPTFVSVLSLVFVVSFVILPRGASAQLADGRGESFVLVKRSAFFHAAPDPASERVRDSWASRYQARVGPYWVLRYEGERDGWVEVSTMGAFVPADHCYPTVAGLSGMEVRLHVRRRDLADVVTRSVETTFDDRSVLRLRPGAGGAPRGQSFRVELPGATVDGSVPTANLGYRYRVADPFALPERMMGLLAPSATIRFSAGSLTAERAPRRQASAVIDFSAPDDGSGEPSRTVWAVGLAGEHRVVQGACAEVVGALAEGDITRERPPRSRAFRERRGTTVRSGATLYWPDGQIAGRTVGSASLDGRPEAQGSKFCFAHPLRPESRGRPDDTLRLCVDRSFLGSR